MMFDYHAAVRGAFFDIAEVAESADDIARQARYLEDGVLFLRDGRIQALLPWQEGERFLHPQKGYRDPEPLRPMIEITSPMSISRSTPFSTWLSP